MERLRQPASGNDPTPCAVGCSDRDRQRSTVVGTRDDPGVTSTHAPSAAGTDRLKRSSGG